MDLSEKSWYSKSYISSLENDYTLIERPCSYQSLAAMKRT